MANHSNFVVEMDAIDEESSQKALLALKSYDDNMKIDSCSTIQGIFAFIIRTKMTFAQVFNLKFIKTVIEIPVKITWKRDIDDEVIENETNDNGSDES